jgi:hypothetical protein
VLALL